VVVTNKVFITERFFDNHYIGPPATMLPDAMFARGVRVIGASGLKNRNLHGD
jgi:hypothetical protein